MNNTGKIAYAAGIVDGEGCIDVNHRTKRRANGTAYRSIRVRVVISNTNLALIDWLHENFGFHRSRPRSQPKPTHKTRYEAALESCKAKAFLELIFPYLVCKKAQALLAIEVQGRIDRLKHGNGTRPMLPLSQEEEAWRLQAITHMRVLNKRGL